MYREVLLSNKDKKIARMDRRFAKTFRKGRRVTGKEAHGDVFSVLCH